ncbi:MAG: Crp/Fnr family transcriptional regulator [Pseudomonadales bacterium]
MYIAELSDSNLPQRVYKLAEQLLDGFASQKQLELASSQNLFAGADAGVCYRINSGGVEVELDNKLLYFLEPGDFIAPLEIQNAGGELVFKCSQPVSLQTYAWEDIAAMLQHDASRMNTWMQFQAASNTIVLHALARYRDPVNLPHSEQLNFAPGETIIKQGATSTHVYKLLEGCAEASQQGVKVGDIKAGEIFGSLAVFTGQKRTATVTAIQACSVQAINEDDFIDMLRLQPNTCRTMFETMAGRIVDLNEAMLALEPEEA